MRPAPIRGFAPPRYTIVPDEIFDKYLPILTGTQLKVLLYIVRRTLGFGRDRDTISLSQMEKGIQTRDGRVLDAGTGVSREMILRAIPELERLGLVEAIRHTSPEKGHESTEYRLRFADAEADEVTEPAAEPPIKVVVNGKMHHPWPDNPATSPLLSASNGTPLAGRSDQGVAGPSGDPLPGDPALVAGPSGTQETVLQETVEQETGERNARHPRVRAPRTTRARTDGRARREPIADTADAAPDPPPRPVPSFSDRTIWDMIRTDTAATLANTTSRNYLAATRLVEIGPDGLVVGACSTFAAQWLSERVDGIARQMAAQTIGRPVEIRWVPLAVVR